MRSLVMYFFRKRYRGGIGHSKQLSSVPLRTPVINSDTRFTDKIEEEGFLKDNEVYTLPAKSRRIELRYLWTSRIRTCHFIGRLSWLLWAYLIILLWSWTKKEHHNTKFRESHKTFQPNLDELKFIGPSHPSIHVRPPNTPLLRLQHRLRYLFLQRLCSSN